MSTAATPSPDGPRPTDDRAAQAGATAKPREGQLLATALPDGDPARPFDGARPRRAKGTNR